MLPETKEDDLPKIKKNAQQEFNELLTKAKAGDPEAQFEVGECYAHGTRFTDDQLKEIKKRIRREKGKLSFEDLLSGGTVAKLYLAVELANQYPSKNSLDMNFRAKAGNFDFTSYSAIHWAAREGNYIGIAILVDAGVNPNSVSSDGNTPLHTAIYHLQEKTTETMKWKRRGGSPYTGRLQQIADYIATIKILLEVGADPNKTSNNGNTALHDCLNYLYGLGNIFQEIEKLLIEHGARYGDKNRKGVSAENVKQKLAHEKLGETRRRVSKIGALLEPQPGTMPRPGEQFTPIRIPQLDPHPYINFKKVYIAVPASVGVGMMWYTCAALQGYQPARQKLTQYYQLIDPTVAILPVTDDEKQLPPVTGRKFTIENGMIVEIKTPNLILKKTIKETGDVRDVSTDHRLTAETKVPDFALQKNAKEMRETTADSMTTETKSSDVKLQETIKTMRDVTESSIKAIQDFIVEIDGNGEELLEQHEQFAGELSKRFQMLKEQEIKFENDFIKEGEDLYDKQKRIEKSLAKIQQKMLAINASDKDNKEKLPKLQKQQDILLQHKQDIQKRLAEREILSQNQILTKFYRVMFTKLSGLFLVCMVADTGSIKTEPNLNSREKLVKKIVGVIGDNIPLPGTKAVASFIKAMIDWRGQKRTNDRNEAITVHSPRTFAEKEAAIEEAVQETIHRYEQQILSCKVESISDLAECAVNRIAEGFSREASRQDEKSTEEASDPFPIKMVNFLHQDSLKQGRWGFSNKNLATEEGVTEASDPWNEDGVFRRTGIRSEHYFFYDEDGGQSKAPCRYKKYGFRFIKDDKLAERIATQLGFNHKTNQAPEGSYILPMQSLQSEPPQKAPEGFATFFPTVKAAVAIAKIQIDETMAHEMSENPQAVLSVVTDAGKAAENGIKQVLR